MFSGEQGEIICRRPRSLNFLIPAPPSPIPFLTRATQRVSQERGYRVARSPREHTILSILLGDKSQCFAVSHAESRLFGGGLVFLWKPPEPPGFFLLTRHFPDTDEVDIETCQTLWSHGRSFRPLLLSHLHLLLDTQHTASCGCCTAHPLLHSNSILRPGPWALACSVPSALPSVRPPS